MVRINLHILLTLISVFFFNTISAQNISIVSWNLKDFGRSKSDAEINIIAKTVKGYDVVLIQEVVAKDPGGAQAVGRLGDALNRTGTKWEYRVSEWTSGESSYKRERYAFLWKTSKVSMVGKPWLEKRYEAEINREPFYATFKIRNKEFTLANYHAITKNLQPETEVKYFKYLPGTYPNLNLIFCGDFNLPQSHTVFKPLKQMGFSPALVGQKTTLKNKCKSNDCLSSEFDNFFFPTSKFKLINSGILPFYRSFSDFDKANNLSDHVPIYFSFSIK